MDPGLIGLEVDLHAIDVVDVLLGVDSLQFGQNLFDEGAVAELDLVLGNIVLRIGLL